MGLIKKNIVNIVTIFFSISFIFIIIEFGLRVAGKKPWAWYAKANILMKMPNIVKNDNQLGWVNRSGVYKYTFLNRPITLTIQSDGTRGKQSLSKQDKEIWFFGCSLTHGWGLTDGQEYPALIAEQLPNIKIRNFAVSGYSILQAKMLYERIISTVDVKPKLIVFGFSNWQSERNVATKSWLILLKSTSKRYEWIKTPYARISNDGNLQIFPPKGYPKWPFSEYSVFLQFLQNRIASINNKEFIEQQRVVTIELLNQWYQQVKKNNIEFLTIVLHAQPKPRKYYTDKFDALNIPYIGCIEANYPAAETRLRNDGHPNQLANQRWADCLLRRFMSQGSKLLQQDGLEAEIN